MLEIRDLAKRYGDVVALAGIDLDVPAGTVTALLGPNGAGKTTTVEILEGYRRRSGGEISVLGEDPQNRDIELRKRVGIVLQESGFHPRATPRELVELTAAAYPSPRDPRETLALVGLTGKEDQHTKKLSGGQRRRLDLALALVGDPELVFLDEPTTGFDPAARRTAWDSVRALKELGKTVLLTTHYLDEAQALADRVGIVRDGALIAEGAPTDLRPERSRYRVAYNRNGHREEHETDDPTELLHRLTSEALAKGERLENLSVGRPTLEEVYMELMAEE
jgi:ABC-2 type transport system ATP-binding protein